MAMGLGSGGGGSPRSQNRGPVEAALRSSSLNGTVTLHDPKIVAPLKRRSREGLPVGVNALHDPKIVAPLKRAFIGERIGNEAELSTIPKSWPR